MLDLNAIDAFADDLLDGSDHEARLAAETIVAMLAELRELRGQPPDEPTEADPAALQPGQRIRHNDGDEYILIERKTGADAEPFPGWWLRKLEPPHRCGLADGNWKSGEWALVGGRSAAPTRDEVAEAIGRGTRSTDRITERFISQATNRVVALLSRPAAEPPTPALPLALTEADAHNLGRVMTVCDGCRKGHYMLGGKVTNYPCTTAGCGCWFCNTPTVTPAQAHAAGGVAAEPNEETT